MTTETVPRSILVPIDFSEPAEAALDFAVALAAKLDATVHILNVVDMQGYHFADLGASLTSEMIDKIMTGNQTALDRIANARRGVARIGEVLLRTGDPRDIIDRVATELKVDLIAMGTHGRRGFKRMMLGSVAEAVVRTAPCPVLTVRPPQ